MPLIEASRDDGQLLARRAADAALEIVARNPIWKNISNKFNKQGGLARLSSYLCLEERGDQSTIWALNDDNRITPFARTFRRRLYKRIERRLADEYKKKLEAERKLPDNRGAIMFD